MVVTDLHGDWDVYQRYRDRFVDLQATGSADCLILTGDLIHAENELLDRSIDIVLDVLALQNSYGSAIIYLCGNHELPHIYGLNLAKGDRVYTPDFEKVLTDSKKRDEVIGLFASLLFYVRTRAGVSITHAGSPAAIALPNSSSKLFNWSHQAILDWAQSIIDAEDTTALQNGYAKLNQGTPYDTLARYYLAVSGPEDPRYNHLLRGFIAGSHPDFDQILWPALFTRNEHEYGAGSYKIFLDALLKALSIDFTPQQVLVAGHIATKGGYKIVVDRHLRIASGQHATPLAAGQYLLFDTTQPVQSPDQLLNGLHSVFKG